MRIRRDSNLTQPPRPTGDSASATPGTPAMANAAQPALSAPVPGERDVFIADHDRLAQFGADTPVSHGAAAYERVANILMTSYEKFDDGRPDLLSLDIALERAGREAPLLRAFYAEVAAAGPVDRAHIVAALDARIATLAAADVDQSGGISKAERATLDAMGDLATTLADALRTREPVAAAAAHVFGDKHGEALKAAIRDVSAAHEELTYSYARTVLFSELHNQAGEVGDLYSPRTIETTGTPRNLAVQKMNTEHTFPKSRGVKDLPALSDLHHLFPTDQETNGKRASHPYGVVTGHIEFEKADSKLGQDAQGNLVFEPPDKSKGAIARALMYVATVYDLDIDDVGGAELLRAWNTAHPPTHGERARNAAISKHQGNRNPFVDLPELADRAFGPAA